MEDDGCLLCKYTGGDNNFINCIPGYVAENIDRVSVDEMCQHKPDTAIQRRRRHDSGASV